MNDGTVNSYARMAEKEEREKVVTTINRSSVPMTQGWAMYKRFRPDTEFVTVTTLQGKSVEITRTQADVLDVARTYIDQRISMAMIADELGVARSTVWRALVKLTSYGLIAYRTARGFRHGTIILARGKNDPFDRLQRAAQATVRKWAEATKARLERVRASVATIVLEEGRRGDSLSDYFLVHSGRNMARPWSAEEIAETLG